MEYNIDKILKEWSYRVPKGIDVTNSAHLSELNLVLIQEGWNTNQIFELMKNLTENTDEDWWKEMSAEEQEKYLNDHPGSKKAKEAEDKKKISEKGKLSDYTDELSDGEVKQKALDLGYKRTEDFIPAPGNAGSMFSEIMSGESGKYLKENPDLTDEELANAIYEQTLNTTLGQQIGGGAKVGLRGKFAGKIKKLYEISMATAKSGRKKYERTNQGIELLTSQNKLSQPIKTRNFYGSQVSLQKQIELIEKLSGPFYTRKGAKIPKEELIDLIKKSGKTENPSDTSTITIDSKERVMIEFHSDKLTTGDIQANSTPNFESET